MANYNIIENNRTFTCANGIYLDSVDNNIIVNNLCTTGTLNGIYATTSNKNRIANNTITANDSNTANPQAAIYLDVNSNYNVVSSNSITNNNNAGIGSTYGVYIGNANCGNNTIQGNVSTGNDATYLDLGTQTDIIYYCNSVTDLTDAITSIGSNKGQINLGIGTFTLTADNTINGGGIYLIEGQGDSTIIHSDDFMAFNITSAAYCSIKNLKIDATGCTTAARQIISITEGSDRAMLIENVHVIGGSDKGRCIQTNSDNIVIRNCKFEEALYGVYIASNNNAINGNTILAIDTCGVYISSNAITNVVTTNNISDSGTYGIYLGTSSDNTIINSNIIKTSVNAIYVSSNSIGLEISGNSISTNTSGVSMVSGGIAVITGNNFYDNIQGIYGNDCSFTISGNVFLLNASVSNCTDAIYFGEAVGSITGNYILTSDPNNASNLHGIRMDTTTGTVISGNYIYNFKNTGAGTGYGIQLTANSIKVALVGNTIRGCDTNLDDSGTNTFKQTAAADPYNNLIA